MRNTSAAADGRFFHTRILFSLLLMLLSLPASAWAAPAKRVELVDINDEYKGVRIYLNYQDPTERTHVMRHTNWQFDLELPIPSRWEVVRAALKVKYVSSIALKPSRSLIAIGLNDRVLFQNVLNKPDVPEQVELKLPPDDFEEFNKVFFRVNQHYTIEGCEDETSPELWTELDIRNSYVDLVIRERDVPERICSVYAYLFDKKSMVKEHLNFVFPPLPTDKQLFRNAFLAGSLGKYLSYRDVLLTADREIVEEYDNIIVGLRSDVRALLLDTFGVDGFGGAEEFERKLRGNINMVANPNNPKRAMLIFTGETDEELDKAVFAFPSLDFTVYTESSITILENIPPEPSEPYTAPGFIPVNKKILFSEMGYQTTTFTGMISPPGEAWFKVYPDYYFERKSQVKMFLHIIYPRMVRFDSIMNLFLNDKFVYQVALDYQERDKDNFINEWLDIDRLTEFPIYLVNKGTNNLSIDSRMIPFKKGKCEIFNRENLQVTLLDDSYIQLPPVKRWVEMPYLDHIASSAYPYSIYPDLSDTAILVTDISSTTLASALQWIYFLSKQIGFPPYRLSISSQFDEGLFDKHLILLGNNNGILNQMMEGAPLYLSDQGIWKRIRFVDRFLEHLPYFSEERLDKQRYAMDTLEAKEHLISVIMQMYRSPYNSDKTILSILSDHGGNLLSGVRRLLSPEMLGSVKGDVTVLSLCDDCPEQPDEDEEYDYVVQSFDINRKYYLGDIGKYEQLKFYISNNPLQLIAGSFVVVTMLVLVIRELLKKYKQRRHKNAEA